MFVTEDNVFCCNKQISTNISDLTNVSFLHINVPCECSQLVAGPPDDLSGTEDCFISQLCSSPGLLAFSLLMGENESEKDTHFFPPNPQSDKYYSTQMPLVRTSHMATSTERENGNSFFIIFCFLIPKPLYLHFMTWVERLYS